MTVRLRLRRRAFTVTELMAVLMLLGAVAIVGTRLFTSTIKLGHNYGEAQNAVTSAGFATALLRDDVAAAKDFKSTGPSTVELTMPDDQPITWTVKGDHMIRAQGTEQEQWRTPAPGATFAADGTSVVLKFNDPDFGELWMTNQGKLTEKLTQP